MSFPLHRIPEPDLVAAILNKMSPISFARVQQSSKDIHLFVEQKSRAIHVKTNGFFDVGLPGMVIPAFSGFDLDSICFWIRQHDESPFLFYTKEFIEVNDFAHLKPALNHWTGRVLIIHPSFPVTTEALDILKPKTVIASHTTTFWLLQTRLEMLICNGLPHIDNSQNIRKILFKPLEFDPEKTVHKSVLAAMVAHWSSFLSSEMTGNIMQANKIDTVTFSLKRLAVDVCQPLTGMAEITSKVEHWDGQTIEIKKMTRTVDGEVTVAAFWVDGSEKCFSCKVYFGFDGEITPDMLRLDAIYNE